MELQRDDDTDEDNHLLLNTLVATPDPTGPSLRNRCVLVAMVTGIPCDYGMLPV